MSVVLYSKLLACRAMYFLHQANMPQMLKIVLRGLVSSGFILQFIIGLTVCCCRAHQFFLVL